MIVKYLRVSTNKQDAIRQELEFNKLGIEFDREYIDEKGGDQSQLKRMIFELTAGDIVYCDSIIRLGRNMSNLFNILGQLANKSIRFISIKEGIDTGSIKYKQEMNKLALLSLLSEQEIEMKNIYRQV